MLTRNVALILLLQQQAPCLGLSLVQDSVTKDNGDPNGFAMDKHHWHKPAMGNPMRQIQKGVSPFFSAPKARKFNLAYKQYLDHPIIKRYMTKNNLMAVVPTKDVQQVLLESILPPLSPYAKVGLINLWLPPHYVPRTNEHADLSRINSEYADQLGAESIAIMKKFFEDKKNELECLKNFFESFRKSDPTLMENFLHPYDGMQIWVSMNTNNTKVREFALEQLNTLLKEAVPRGVKDIDSYSSPVWQFLPVLSEASFVISEDNDAKFDCGDTGKNIIISNQRSMAMGALRFAEGTCLAAKQDIMFLVENTPMTRTTKFVHQKIFMTWTPVWQRYNYLMYQLRNQDGKVLVPRFQEMLARDDLNEDCKVIENRELGGKTWETKCLLGKPARAWLTEKVKEADKDGDGEISFAEHLDLSTQVGDIFQPTAPSYRPTEDGSSRAAFIKEADEDLFNEEDLLGIDSEA